MGTRQHKWRSTSTVYVDTRTGSDMTGDGSQYKPYKSVHRAIHHYQPTVEIPTNIPNIAVKGTFTGQLSYGCLTSIIGSAWGEAIYDAQGIYCDYGFRHSNLIIKNCALADSNTVIGNFNNRSYQYAGVGSPYHAVDVGNGYGVYGVYGSSVLIHNSPLYWGCIHNYGGSRIIYSSLKQNGTYKLSFGGDKAQQTYDTYYKCRIVDRRLDTGLTTCTHKDCLFVDFDMFVNDRLTLNRCFFTADCLWYYQRSSVNYKIIVDDTITGDTVSIVEDDNAGTSTIGGGTVYSFIQDAVAGGMSLAKAKLSAIPTVTQALYAAGKISTKLNFVNCVFSTQVAADTFNNADLLDFTLKITSEAVEGALELNRDYFGALPPALNIPIYDNSDGHTNCWETRSFKGLLKVDGDKIVIDTTSQLDYGEGMTKVIPLNSVPTQDKILSGIFTEFSEKFSQYGISFWEDWELIDSDNPIALSATATTLTKGVANAPAYYIIKGSQDCKVKVVVNGDILEGNEALTHSQIIFVASTDTVTAEVTQGTAELYQILDSNLPDCLYVRMQQVVYRQAETGEIKAGATYLNSGETTITYDSHQIVQGESFIGIEGINSFTGAASGYKVDVIFDDDPNPETRLVPYQEWIPASFWDTFYVKVNSLDKKLKYYLGWTNDTTVSNAQTTRAANQAVSSSGNYLSRVTTTGYNLYIGEKFLQFRLKCKKVFDV